MALATRERILKAAGTALLRNPNTTVDRIATEARVGRATVFRHFGSRAGLLRALAVRAIAETDSVTRQAAAHACTATDALRLVTRAVVGAGESFRFLDSAAELQDELEIAEAYRRQLSELADLVRAARREGFIRPDVPTAWVVASIDGLIWAGCRAVGDGELGVVQAQDLVWETIANGLSAERKRRYGPAE
ncbi:MAG: TetR/AcrR family transcriptional regulator [Gemmatimonadetes bacterium]|nr:TetR/AcrR family transcriptional regulator [Gemmatimonadota bacterium]MCY3676321.1 TetR/AcrR family transcriptional regulator [Gemmatimonadota bacterium]MYA44644.1 TetR/AcrR family transcriptional regulator [Gemmatimonadota bacterium]MYE94176.1 TetR/AcrR family transcriptional regulator [Gemmatimonadota bacterium]MYJ09525.1 TetR/AcrR family transcriptional regulator [Gemmatimonadota bacterium]